METLERHGVSFVSVTQQFDTTTSTGRLMLNMLLSFALKYSPKTGPQYKVDLLVKRKVK